MVQLSLVVDLWWLQKSRAAVTSRIIIICVVDPGRERQRVKCLVVDLSGG